MVSKYVHHCNVSSGDLVINLDRSFEQINDLLIYSRIDLKTAISYY